MVPLQREAYGPGTHGYAGAAMPPAGVYLQLICSCRQALMPLRPEMSSSLPNRSQQPLPGANDAVLKAHHP